jgi:hypothetical protein
MSKLYICRSIVQYTFENLQCPFVICIFPAKAQVKVANSTGTFLGCSQEIINICILRCMYCDCVLTHQQLPVIMPNKAKWVGMEHMRPAVIHALIPGKQDDDTIVGS